MKFSSIARDFPYVAIDCPKRPALLMSNDRNLFRLKKISQYVSGGKQIHTLVPIK